MNVLKQNKCQYRIKNEFSNDCKLKFAYFNAKESPLSNHQNLFLKKKANSMNFRNFELKF